MTATLEPTARGGTTETFDSLNPANGDVVGTHPITQQGRGRRRRGPRARGRRLVGRPVVRRARPTTS